MLVLLPEHDAERNRQKHHGLWHCISVGAHKCNVRMKSDESCNDQLNRK